MTTPDSDVGKIISTYFTRKGVGNFLKKIHEEYLKDITINSVQVDCKNGTINFFLKQEDETLDVQFSFYKTGWRVRITTNGYYSSYFGRFESGTRHFQCTKDLNDYLNECKYKKIAKEKEIDDLTPFDSISNLSENIKNLLLDNESCIQRSSPPGREHLGAIKFITSVINDFRIDSDELTILNLFRLFTEIDEKVPDDLHKDLTLYMIAKEILDVKYGMVKLNREKYEIKGFEIQAKSQPFAYAHVLQFYGGKCKWLHGHNGEIVIKATVDKNTIEKRPMFLSYGFLKSFLKHMDKNLDHKTFWALNPESKYSMMIGGSFKVVTPKQTIIFHDTEGHVLLPFFKNSSPYSTSEVTLFNYVLPHFLIYMIRFHIQNSGPDSTPLAFCDLSELIKFSFSWYETETTVCTVHVNC